MRFIILLLISCGISAYESDAPAEVLWKRAQTLSGYKVEVNHPQITELDQTWFDLMVCSPKDQDCEVYATYGIESKEIVLNITRIDKLDPVQVSGWIIHEYVHALQYMTNARADINIENDLGAYLKLETIAIIAQKTYTYKPRHTK